MALVVAPGAGAPKTPAPPPPAAKSEADAEAKEGVIPKELAVGVIAPPPEIKGA